MADSSAGTAFQRAGEAVSSLRVRLPQQFHQPSVAIICGSGLGGLQHTLDEEKISFPYETIPHFPRSTVQGHEGKLVFGTISSNGIKTPVVLLVGRAHFYEGHSMDLVTFATRVCKRLDVQTIIVTNAAGGLNPDYAVGDIVLLHDHLNLAGLVGVHPLRGPNEESFGTRFPPLSDAYDLSLRRAAHTAWRKLGLASASAGSKERKLREGVYAFVGGPSYETRAECRMLRTLGADLVGMSTVPEIIVARHAGLRVLAFSLVTNNAVLEEGVKGDDEAIQGLSEAELQTQLTAGKANHEEVLEAGRQAAEVMQSLVKEIIAGV